MQNLTFFNLLCLWFVDRIKKQTNNNNICSSPLNSEKLAGTVWPSLSSSTTPCTATSASVQCRHNVTLSKLYNSYNYSVIPNSKLLFSKSFPLSMCHRRFSVYCWAGVTQAMLEISNILSQFWYSIIMIKKEIWQDQRKKMKHK